MSKIRKNYDAQEKAKIVLEAWKGELTQSQLTSKYGVHSTQIHNWKKQALSGLAGIFSDNQKRQEDDQKRLVEELYRQIGQLSVELDWMKKKAKLFE